LAATSKYDVARAPRTESYTVFTGAVLAALGRGVPYGQPKISIYELYEGVRDALVRRKHTDGNDYGMPEIHVPDQRDGDVSRLPIFPNAAYSSVESSNRVSADFEELVHEDGPDLVDMSHLSSSLHPDAKLLGASLARADLSGAVLTRSDLRRANLERANLVGA